MLRRWSERPDIFSLHKDFFLSDIGAFHGQIGVQYMKVACLHMNVG